MASEDLAKEVASHGTGSGANQSSDQSPRAEKHLARGMEDVSHLFLSRLPEGNSAKEEGRDTAAEQPRVEPAKPIITVCTAPCTAVNREHVISLLHKHAGALEEGMRVIDLNIPCDPYGPIDLLAVDGTSQLAIVDIDVCANDGMLLRAICHFDWILRNMPIVRRMYHGHVINFASHPRIFLVAPQFPPMLMCGAHRITAPRVSCVRYHSVAVPGGTGIFFERA